MTIPNYKVARFSCTIRVFFHSFIFLSVSSCFPKCWRQPQKLAAPICRLVCLAAGNTPFYETSRCRKLGSIPTKEGKADIPLSAVYDTVSAWIPSEICANAITSSQNLLRKQYKGIYVCIRTPYLCLSVFVRYSSSWLGVMQSS